ncbi:hypothetical protein [Actinomycetospora corticicola]|uniref:hypothetical protein n=1 Tax=Actinomycetospora corticicola TaxID=663602 RepID=UPI001C53FC2B|nr:hypothetical protein [Actinomycetospora corticicola]
MAVAVGAAAATAHGLYEVAVAARVPAGIAWLYPLITDGLALVAYAATARLSGRPARYAWAVVVIAAGLSGLAQAAYLAGEGDGVATPSALRFGVGAWPAIAAAVVAHLLYLLAHDTPDAPRPADAPVQGSAVDGVQPLLFTPPDVQPSALSEAVHPAPAADGERGRSDPVRAAASPLRDRAEATARRHARRNGRWPTVSELEAAAEVSRGTAAAALKALRAAPLPAPRLLADSLATTRPATAVDEASESRDDNNEAQTP